MRLPKLVTTLQSYNRGLFIADLVAGVTVAMVALPLSLAIAIASGAEPERGLVTAIIGGFFISALGGSRVQIGGPTGAFIVVVAGVIGAHGYDGLVLATFMAGMILLVAGFFRAGRLARFVPDSVINGFTIGIAIIIATSQLKDFFGLNLASVPADFLPKVVALWAARDSFNASAVLISTLTLLLIVTLRWRFAKFPGLIVAVTVTSVLLVWAGLSVDTIHSRFGALPDHLPMPEIPMFDFSQVVELLPSALVIAFLAGIESLLSATVADRMSGGHHRPNAELIAQGAANVASSLFGGMPATGAIARTATNVRAGAQTPVAGIIHAAVLLLVMLLAAPLAGFLAMPALATVLMVTAWNMSEPHKWQGYLAAPVTDRMLMLVTLVLTVVVDLSVAIIVGVALGIAVRYFRK